MFDTEPNDAPLNALRKLVAPDEALGFLTGGGDVDRYQMQVTAGQPVLIILQALLDSPDKSPQNTLDPALRVIAADGTTIRAADTNSLDGKNARVAFTAPVNEQLTIEARSTTGSGEYLLQTMAEIDFGDAAAPFATTLRNNGARHAAQGPRLGNRRDSELDGQPTALADGDDLNGVPDDEDGVTLSRYSVGQSDGELTVSVQNVQGQAYLNAWVDFNGDGKWSGTDEQIAQDLVVTQGLNPVYFTVPRTADVGFQPARFRLSSSTGLWPVGLAHDGEVEDYLFEILEPPPEQPELRIDSVALPEGDSGLTPFVFTVTRNHNRSAVTVRVQTTPGSATAGDDYVSMLTVLDFPAGGPLTRTVTVDVKGDTLHETNEQFTVGLSRASGALIEVPTGIGTILNDDAPPKVTAVHLGSSQWATSFLSAIDPTRRLGFSIPAGNDQLKTLPWSNLDRIYVSFDKELRRVDRTDVSLVGSNVLDYGPLISDVTYVNRMATISLSTKLGRDKLLLKIRDSVVDLQGNALDGEWKDRSSSFPSGNGNAGGSFLFRFNVLPGDASRNGGVLTEDVDILSNALGALLGNPRYVTSADINGSAGVGVEDIGALNTNLGKLLPWKEPIPPLQVASPPGLLAGEQVAYHDQEDPEASVDDLFADEDFLTSLPTEFWDNLQIS